MRKRGERIRELLAERALTLTEAARLAGVSVGGLSEIMAGKRRLSGSVAWRLSKILGPKVLELLPRSELLARADLSGAQRRPDLDADGLRAFGLPGGARLLLPRALARRVAHGVAT